MKKRLVVLTLLVFSFSLGKAQVYDTLDFQNWNQISKNGVLEIDSMDAVWNIDLGILTTDTTWSGYPTNSDGYFYFHINVDSSFLLTEASDQGKLIITHFLDMSNPTDFGQIQFYSNGNWYDISQAFLNYWHVEYDQNYFLPYFISNNYFFTDSYGTELESAINIFCSPLFSPDNINRSGNIIPFRIWFHSDSIPYSGFGWAIQNIIFQNFNGTCIGGINENTNQLQLSVYPTLTDSKITFESENEKFSKISIYDNSGKQIENFNFIPSNFQTLHLSNLTNGLYFYSVDNGQAKGKFIVEK